MPWTFAADRHRDSHMESCSQFAKLPYLGSCPAPLFEVAHSQAPSQPGVYFRNRPIIFRNPEVVHPAAEIFGKLLIPIAHGDKPGPTGQLFDPSLEFTEGFLRPVNLGSTESEAKKDSLICRDDSAFLLVDLEFEGAFQEAFQASHDPFARPSAFHQNDEVVGIANKTMSTLLKLFIEIIQENVGK